MFTCCNSNIGDDLQFEIHFKFTPMHYREGKFKCLCQKDYLSFHALKAHFISSHSHLARGVLFRTEDVIRSSDSTTSNSNSNFWANNFSFEIDSQENPIRPADAPDNECQSDDSFFDFFDKFSSTEISFIKLLNDLKFNTTVTEKHLNLISSKILDFVFCNLNLLDVATFNRLKQIFNLIWWLIKVYK